MSNAPVNDLIVKACQSANDAYMSGYGKISTFIRNLKDSASSPNGPDLGEIEASINAAVEGYDKPTIQKLDKAYQAASRRILEHVIGLKFDDDEERGFFHIPVKRERAKPDAINVAFKHFMRNPGDQDAYLKLTAMLHKRHMKHCNTGDSTTDSYTVETEETTVAPMDEPAKVA